MYQTAPNQSNVFIHYQTNNQRSLYTCICQWKFMRFNQTNQPNVMIVLIYLSAQYYRYNRPTNQMSLLCWCCSQCNTSDTIDQPIKCRYCVGVALSAILAKQSTNQSNVVIGLVLLSVQC